jgi:superfamily II DNA helicase RecQ
MLDASKRGQMRKKGAYCEADLLTVARRLHNAPNMQFWVLGQRNGVIAIMGPQPAEQVVLILGTGSGKILVFQVGTAVADAWTTILVLPAVALQDDMLTLTRFHVRIFRMVQQKAS